MSSELVILVLLIVTALAFDFTNGFHDTGNAMATSIATGALKPKTAVTLAGILNLVGQDRPVAIHGVQHMFHEPVLLPAWPPGDPRTSRIVFAAYASKRYLDRVGRDRPLTDYDWLGFDGPLLRVQQAKWLAATVPESRIRLRYDSFSPLQRAVSAHLGCAVLPWFACVDDPDLERLPGTATDSAFDLWVLTHPDLRKSARVRAFLQFFGTRLAALDDSVMGRGD